MRLLLVTACAVLVSGCESFNAKLDASRQDRCQRANWTEVGERDGFQDARGLAERYEHICGDMFQATVYQEAWKSGYSRRPTGMK